MHLSQTNAHSTNDIHLAREIKGSVAKSEKCHWLAWICKRRMSRISVQMTYYFVTFSSRSRLISRFNRSIGNTYPVTQQTTILIGSTPSHGERFLLCRNEKSIRPIIIHVCKINGLMNVSTLSMFIFKGVLHLLPKISMFCALSQNNQQLFEK